MVVPAYHSSGTLQRALDSIYAQSAPPCEILVVDDGSDDWEQTARIVASAPAGIATRFIRLERNEGPSAARNAGMAAARGRYLAFLDADDIWYPEKLAIQYEVMTRCSLDFSAHDYVDDLPRLASAISTVRPRRAPSMTRLSSWRLPSAGWK